ncbi:MAG: hypothetical protein AMXMBFR13_35560 [Phycisphaerae bacterium]
MVVVGPAGWRSGGEFRAAAVPCPDWAAVPCSGWVAVPCPAWAAVPFSEWHERHQPLGISGGLTVATHIAAASALCTP